MTSWANTSLPHSPLPPKRYVCMYVCVLVTTVGPAKTDKPIKMPFGLWTRVGPRNHSTNYVMEGPGSANRWAFWGETNVPKHRYTQCHSQVSSTQQRGRSLSGGSTLGPGGWGVQAPQIVARPPNLAVLLTHCGQLIL